MSVPYDYDQTNIEHLRAVVAEQEQTIEYLHERCKAEEVENAKLQASNEVIAEDHAALCEQNAKLRELLSSLWKRVHSPISPNVERDYLAEMRKLGVEVD